MVSDKIKLLLNHVNNNINSISLFFLPIIVLAIGNYYVASSHTLWIYDMMIYHDMTAQMVVWYNSMFERFLAIYRNIFIQEYNNFFTLFLFPFIKAFPFSRYLFISSLLLVFFIPTILLLRIFFKEILSIKNNILLVYISFLAIIFIPFLKPTLLGWADIFGYIPLILFYIMYFKSPIENRNYKSVILMSFLFYMPFLIRRIYIYEMIAFTLFVILYVLFDTIYNRKFSKTYLKNLFLKHFIFGLGVIIFALCLQYKIILHIIFTSYSNAYSNYQANSYYEHFFNLYNHVGKYFLMVAILGSILGIFSKYRKITIFFTFNTLVTFFLFTLTQKMGPQHVLDTVALGIFILNIIATLCIINYIKSFGFKVLFLLVIGIINIFAFLSTIEIKHSKFSKYLINNKIISNPSIFLLIEPNFNEKLSILNKVNNFLSKTTGAFYVLTHGEYIYSVNFVSYNFYYLHTWDNQRNLWPSIQDARDLINGNIFKAKYIIMESTGQSEFREQKVVSIPFREITQYKKNIGRAFKKTHFKYVTPSDVEIWIYEKTRPFTKQEIQDFLDEFYIFYPNWKEIYNNKVDDFYNMQ